MKNTFTIIVAIFLLGTPLLGHAYIGPGSGLSAIGSVLAFLATVVLLFVGFLWYPIKRFLKGKQDEEEVEIDANVEIREEDA